MNDFTGYGFAAGEIRGTRAWKVDALGRLRGVVHEKIWKPGENLAECLRLEDISAPGIAVRITGGHSASGGGVGGSSRFQSQVIAGRASAARFLSAGGAYCACGCGRAMEVIPATCSGMDPECVCGFYGYQEGSNDYYQPMSMGGDVRMRGPIGGVFRGYGKVVLGTRGFRAEKAEILALYVDADEIRQSDDKITNTLIRLRIEQNYKVPVFDEYLKMLQEFPPDPPERDRDGSDLWGGGLT